MKKRIAKGRYVLGSIRQDASSLIERRSAS
jgi:hypothetical protein